MKKRTKFLSMVLSGLLILSSFGGFVTPQMAFAKDGVTDFTAEAESYDISSAEDLAAFRNALSSGNFFAGKTINLTKDIALTPSDSVGTLDMGPGADNAFAGTFNGNGHSITGWTDNSQSLFNIVDKSGVVKNLLFDATLDNARVESMFVYRNKGTISKVALTGSITASNNACSSFCQRNEGTISKCISYADVNSTYSKTAKKKIAGFVNDTSGGTANYCMYVGKITSAKPAKAQPYGFTSNDLDSETCVYLAQEVDNNADDEKGTSLTRDKIVNASELSALGFDMVSDWKIDESFGGFPHLLFPKEETPSKNVPVKVLVSVEDCVYDPSMGDGPFYFPLKARFVYTGSNQTIADSFDTIVAESEFKAVIKEDKWKKDFPVKTPIDGISADFSKKKASYYFKTSYKEASGYSFVVESMEFEDTTGTYRDNPDISNVLTKEEKDKKIADMETAAKRILDLCYEKNGNKITRDPFLAFTCGRLNYYPAGLTKDDFYNGLVGVYKEYKEYVASRGEIQEVTETSKYVLAFSAMGFDPRQFGDYDMLEELANADVNGKYFAPHYKAFAIYSGRYGDYEETLSSLIANVYGKPKDGNHDAEDMPVMHMQPIGLKYNKNATPADGEAYEIKQYVENTVIPWMENCVTGFGAFNSIYTNGQRNVWTDAQAQMLLALVDADFLGEGFVHNGRTIVDAIIAHPELSLGFLDDPSQCARALMALIRSYKGQTNMFDCTDITGVCQVNNMIDNIGEAIDSNNYVELMRVYDIYNALTPIQKTQVKNIGVVKDALNKAGLIEQVLGEETDGGSATATGDNASLFALIMILFLAGTTVIITRRSLRI
ncbi:MAG: hypothetical protein E7241_11390 [Lachnospiraceae bacterium]|nr:hypothetical protein [Lachnospiraceae bacterium]